MSELLYFCCPGCKTLLRIPANRAGVTVSCGKCGRHSVLPAPPTRAATTASPHDHAAGTLRQHPEEVEYARWRYWAAQVRDRQGAYRSVAARDADLAGTLGILLDSWRTLRHRARQPDSARNLLHGLDEGIVKLVETLLAHGVEPPESVRRDEPATTREARSAREPEAPSKGGWEP